MKHPGRRIPNPESRVPARASPRAVSIYRPRSRGRPSAFRLPGASGSRCRRRSCCSPEAPDVMERDVLEDLAAASRILVDQGVFDAAGHVSLRHPRNADRFLMSRSLAPALVTADDIMEFTLDCDACDARG